MVNKTYHFFWGGELSNWHKADFEYEGIKFNCAEQAMMYHKAFLSNDIESAKKILAEKNPRDQKFLGRQVVGFNNNKWNKVKYSLVKSILRAKFTQNENLLKYLKSLKEDIIVEASPQDRIWGIGYHENDAMQNIDKWGENLLGKILTELRNEL